MSLSQKVKVRPYICGVFLCFGTSFTASTSFQNFYNTDILEADVVSLYATSSKVKFTETKTSTRAGYQYKQNISISLPITDELRSEHITRIHQAEQVVLKLTNGEYLFLGRNDAGQNTKPKISYFGDEDVARFEFENLSLYPTGYSNLIETPNEPEPIYNVWIGGIGLWHRTAQEFVDHLRETRNSGYNYDDIINYEVSPDNNVRFYAKTPFWLRNQSFYENNFSYVFDPDGLVKEITSYNQHVIKGEYFYVPNAKLSGFDQNFSGAPNHQIRVLASFRESNIAGHFGSGTGMDTPGVNSTAFRRNGNNGVLIVPQWLATNNNGSPDGDIGVFINNGGSVTYRDPQNTNHTQTPNPVFILSYTILSSNRIRLNVNTNITEGWIIIFINGFIYQWSKLEEFEEISGVNVPEVENIQIIVADQYFNISEFSNKIFL